MSRKVKKPSTIAFIDASNLFYGGQKSLGWNIDYKKLHEYLKTKYGCKKIYYFGGIDTFGFNHNYQSNETVDLSELLKFLRREVKSKKSIRKYKRRINQIESHIPRVKFYKKLQNFGYILTLKPVKRYKQPDGRYTLKANADLDMTLCIIKLLGKYDRAVILTGDGDFLPVLKFIKHNKKEVILLARGNRTAREIRQFAGSNFRDFVRLKKALELNSE